MERVRKTKVYGWHGYRSECKPALNGSLQTREICATTSIKKLCEILGCRQSDLLCLSETGNDEEVRTAMADKGQVFWHGLNEIKPYTWTRVER
jgi:hypothetical protein